mgnify:CR=1 FL=1|jgi:hypothetical protein
MTNGDWIRGLTDEELEKIVLHPCHIFECGECPLTNGRRECVLKQGRIKAMAWLESEREK